GGEPPQGLRRLRRVRVAERLPPRGVRYCRAGGDGDRETRDHRRHPRRPRSDRGRPRRPLGGSRESAGPRREDSTSPGRLGTRTSDGPTGPGESPRLVRHRAGDGPDRAVVPDDLEWRPRAYATTLRSVRIQVLVRSAYV